MDQEAYHEIRTAADVTDDLILQVEDITDGWYADGPIDWEDVWDRLERTSWEGRPIDMGTNEDSPAMRKIRRVIRQRRAEG